MPIRLVQVHPSPHSDEPIRHYTTCRIVATQPSARLMPLVTLLSTNVAVTACFQAVVSLATVGVGFGSRLDVRLDPRKQSLCTGIGNDGHAYAPGAFAEGGFAISPRAFLPLRGPSLSYCVT